MKKPRILITGPIFNTPAGPSGQGGKLFHQLTEEGFVVYRKSAHRNRFLRLFDTLIGVLSFWKYDVMMVQCFGLFAFYLEDLQSRIGKGLGKKVVFTLRGGAFCEFYEQHPHWCHKVLSRVDCINTPSLFIQSFLVKKGYTVAYVPNFINLDIFTFNRDHIKPYSLLWVRAYHTIYHPELAIEAFALIKKKYPQANMTMIGLNQGSLDACKTLIAKLNLTQDILQLDPVPNTELPRYYQTHSVYLNTTRYESFGVAVVEAAACGIPCVSTEVGELPYLWKQEENIVFAERTAEQFANAVTSLWEDELKAKQIGHQAHLKATQFTWSSVRNYWLPLLQQFQTHSK